MKAGSPFFAEMSRITSSSRPGATVSLAMSVTKPWRYLRPTRVSSSGCLADIGPSAARRRARGAGDPRQVGGLEGAVAPHELLEAHLEEGAADRAADALPAVSYEAGRLDAAIAGAARAFRERDRALHCVDDLGGIDGCGWPRELVAAMRAPHRAHEARVLEFLEQLADGREP